MKATSGSHSPWARSPPRFASQPPLSCVAWGCERVNDV